jgi:3-dehydrosphinganine reductase
VGIFGRSEDKLGAARETLEGTAYAASLDVTDAAGTAEVLGRAVADLGVPDLVVSAAGFARAEWFHEEPLDHVRAMIETNYLGTVHVCHALVPHLVREGRGTIVTTSSMAGLTGVFGYAGYSASKFAVVGFSEALVLAAEEKVKTLEPEQVADYLLKVLPKRPHLVIPGFDSRLGHAVVRHLPRLADRVLRRPERAS